MVPSALPNPKASDVAEEAAYKHDHEPMDPSTLPIPKASDAENCTHWSAQGYPQPDEQYQTDQVFHWDSLVAISQERDVSTLNSRSSSTVNTKDAMDKVKHVLSKLQTLTAQFQEVLSTNTLSPLQVVMRTKKPNGPYQVTLTEVGKDLNDLFTMVQPEVHDAKQAILDAVHGKERPLFTPEFKKSFIERLNAESVVQSPQSRGDKEVEGNLAQDVQDSPHRPTIYNGSLRTRDSATPAGMAEEFALKVIENIKRAESTLWFEANHYIEDLSIAIISKGRKTLDTQKVRDGIQMLGASHLAHSNEWFSTAFAEPLATLLAGFSAMSAQSSGTKIEASTKEEPRTYVKNLVAEDPALLQSLLDLLKFGTTLGPVMILEGGCIAYLPETLQVLQAMAELSKLCVGKIAVPLEMSFCGTRVMLNEALDEQSNNLMDTQALTHLSEGHVGNRKHDLDFETEDYSPPPFKKRVLPPNQPSPTATYGMNDRNSTYHEPFPPTTQFNQGRLLFQDGLRMQFRRSV